MPPQPKMSLVDFLMELAKNAGWQKKYQQGGQQWTQLVERELSADDAALVLSGNQAALQEAVTAQAPSPQFIVWLGPTVWQ